MASAQSNVLCPTQRTYTMTLTNTAYQTSVDGMSSGYQSLYSEERRDLHLLEVRKETFIFYPKSSIPTADIATAGFHYTGEGYIIKCHCCKLTVMRLNKRDNPFAVHQSRAPDCPFVRKTVTQSEAPALKSAQKKDGVGAGSESDSSLLIGNPFSRVQTLFNRFSYCFSTVGPRTFVNVLNNVRL